MRLRVRLSLLSLLWAANAGAVVIASGNGSGNTAAPFDDPGFDHVGTLAGATAVYLGAGWVITANHVAAGDPTFGGVSYHVISGSTLQLHNADGTLADLRVFRVHPPPPLAALKLSPDVPPPGADVVMIGFGRDRGASTKWQGYDGWLYAATASLRWGTNRVAARDLNVLGTRAFETDFTQEDGTPDEAQATLGDSGGAVFFNSGGSWTLAGILFAIGPYGGQPWGAALFGNLSYAAQLSDYASEVSTLLARPVCSDGLDNDADGKIDYPADPGCQTASSNTEDPACDNGVDDDGDGLIDLADPGCQGSPWYPYEALPACGVGFELALVLPVIHAFRARRKRNARR